MFVLTVVFGHFRCTTWPESKNPLIKDLSLLLGRSKVVPSELANRTDKQGEKRTFPQYFRATLSKVIGKTKKFV